MINAAIGGSGPTNKTSNKKDNFNEGHNKKRNNIRLDRSEGWYSTEKIKGKVEGLSTLGVK